MPKNLRVHDVAQSRSTITQCYTPDKTSNKRISKSRNGQQWNWQVAQRPRSACSLLLFKVKLSQASGIERINMRSG